MINTTGRALAKPHHQENPKLAIALSLIGHWFELGVLVVRLDNLLKERVVPSPDKGKRYPNDYVALLTRGLRFPGPTVEVLLKSLPRRHPPAT